MATVLERGTVTVQPTGAALGADIEVVDLARELGRAMTGAQSSSPKQALNEESKRLLDALWAHATRPELTWYQQRRGGDLVLRDNRSVLHRRDEFDPKSRRLIHRSQIKGDRPY